MRRHYDFSDGVRGKYAARYAEGADVIVVAPDVAEVFPRSIAVNDAPPTLICTSDKGDLNQRSTKKLRPLDPAKPR